MLTSEDKTFYLELLRAYFDSANDAIFVLCGEMKFLLCNRTMETWLGESEPDLTRHNERLPITRFFREPESERVFLSRFTQALEGRPGRFDCLIQPPQGTPRWVEMHLNKVAMEHGQMVIVVARDITHERRGQANVLKLSSAIEQTADSVVITNLEGVIEYVNPAFEKNTGFSREEVLGGNPRLVKSGEHDAAFYKQLWDTILRGDVFRDVLVNRRKDGSLYYEEKTITPLKDETGRITQFVSTGKDITERRRAEEALTQVAVEWTHSMDFVEDALCLVDADDRFIRGNRAFYKFIGLAPEQVAEHDLASLMHPRGGAEACPVCQARRERRAADITLEADDPNNPCGKPVEVMVRMVRDAQGEVVRMVLGIHDLTHARQVEQRLTQLAYYDILTGLPNRNLFRDRLGGLLGRASRLRSPVALLFLDIDNFRTINDSLGHEVGDLLLKAVAERLRESVRGEDAVARLGGDEFVLVLEGVGPAQDVAAAAQKLLDALAPSFELDGHEVFAGASIGITMYPSDGEDADTLLKNADTAMYRAKERGRNAYQFYTADMTTRVRDHLALRTQLRRALERDELRLQYQPMLDLRSGRVTALEALVRWQHPDHGMIPPDRFIPLAEETGLILPLGEWVLRSVCAQLRAWRETVTAPIRVAVNISGRQFADPNFINSLGCLGCLLGRQGQCAGNMEFEITESVLMRHEQSALDAMRVFREKGIRIAIDDFGTGYSSLSYLTRFHVDTLKIDRSFIRDMAAGEKATALVRAMIAMAHTLELQVVAEGVETPAEVALLRDFDCDIIQGYFFSPPLPVEAIPGFLSASRSNDGSHPPRPQRDGTFQVL